MIRTHKSALIAIILLICMLGTLRSIGAPIDTLRLYFGIDQYQLTDQHKTEIKAMIDSLRDGQQLSITGFCDYLGTKTYNQPLSEKRANAVKDLIQTSVHHFSVVAEGRGQIHGTGTKSPSGDPHNRRVDIVFDRPEMAPSPPKSNPVKFGKKIDSLGTLDVGKSLSLDELTFQPGRHFLRPEAIPLLKILLKHLIDNPNIVFEIRGHVCCEDNGRDGIDIDTGSRELSVNRAREIYRYFLQNGIDKNRMTYTGVGSSQQKIYPEVTSEDQQLNRRVEIVILKK
jgi:outer membrane protein OmpA-like peptidoglycan-associated protein